MLPLAMAFATALDEAAASLSVAVPAAWAVQLRDGGRDNRPGLLVGADLTAWADPDSASPGAFVGSGAPTARPGHQECTRQPGRPVVLGGLTGRVERWTGCAGTSVSFTEALLAGTYVQIKPVEKTDRTDDVLRSLRVH